MRRSRNHPERLRWSLILGVTMMLIAAGTAGAQYPGYGWGGGYPGAGYGYPGVGYGYPGVGYGYPGMGYGYPGFGWGYPAFGYGLAYPAPVYAAAYPGPYPYNWGYGNPFFGVGLSPLGVQSYLYETRVLGRVPRRSAGSSGSAGRSP
jgi:hypothetical protein